MRRARAVYDNDQALFCEVLDALCLGKVGEFQTFGALCESSSAVATVIRTPAARRLIEEIDDAFRTMAESAEPGAVGPSVLNACPDLLNRLIGYAPWVAWVASDADVLSMAVADAGLMEAVAGSDTAMGAFSASLPAIAKIVGDKSARIKFYGSPHYDGSAVLATLESDNGEYFEVQDYTANPIDLSLNGQFRYALNESNGSFCAYKNDRDLSVDIWGQVSYDAPCVTRIEKLVSSSMNNNNSKVTIASLTTRKAVKEKIAITKDHTQEVIGETVVGGVVVYPDSFLNYLNVKAGVKNFYLKTQ